MKTRDLIPVRKIYEDGIFELSDKGMYSVTYAFSDINYTLSSSDDKRGIVEAWGDALASADVGDVIKITSITGKKSEKKIDEGLFVPTPSADSDKYPYKDIIREYNSVLKNKAIASQNRVRYKYITVTTFARKVEDARAHFNRVYQKLRAQLERIGSKLREITAEERLRIFFEFYHAEPELFDFELSHEIKRGHDFRDYIAPVASERINSTTYKYGEWYYRAYFLSHYARFIDDDFIADLSDLSDNIAISLDYEVVPMEEAIRIIDEAEMDVGTSRNNYQRKQQERGNFSGILPYSIESQAAAVKMWLEDLTSNDQSMMIATISVCVKAPTLDDLQATDAALISKAQEKRCNFAKLFFQQTEGIQQVLPYGGVKLAQRRTLTTEGLAGFVPFSVEEVMQGRGEYVGQNLLSRNPIMVDRSNLMNGNCFVIGTSGAGKSMTTKQLILQNRIREDADIIIIDPEREYGELVKALGGEVVTLSPTSKSHINAMDLSTEGESGDDLLKIKSDFIMSFCELVHTSGNSNVPPLGAAERSIIDEALREVYKPYLKGKARVVPTLSLLRKKLQEMNNPKADELATELGLYSDSGSLNAFSHATNVDTNSSLVCYDILEVGTGLKSIAMLVMLDAVFNRIIKNRWKKRKTYVYIDEIYLLFQDSTSADYLFSMWKRVRKYGAFMTGATQNVSDLLQSHTAHDMLANSEFIILLNQNKADVPDLSAILDMTEEQSAYIRNVDFGHGLMKIGSATVPFENTIPTTSSLFDLMTTKIVAEES